MNRTSTVRIHTQNSWPSIVEAPRGGGGGSAEVRRRVALRSRRPIGHKDMYLCELSSEK